MRAARSLGLDIPGDLSLAGFNDIPYSELTAPSLTTVNLFATELGRQAGRMLREYILTGRGPESKALPSALAIRKSTGPAPTSR
jgi:LacI family transcriptional regulator